MRDEAAARRYAKALVDLAVEAGIESAVERDLTDFVALIEGGEGRELGQALRCPVFSIDERKAVLAEVAKACGWSELVHRFLHVLIDRERVADLPAILHHVTQALDARAGRVRLSLQSAAELDPATLAQIQATFAAALGKQVIVETQIEPSLIGGLVARVGSRVYDASLRTRLAEIRHRLIYAQDPAEA